MVGILCGATTNTPALGAAQQTLKQMGMEASTPALGCAVAYPLGVVGVIFAVLIIRKALARKEDLELKEKDDANKTYIAAFQVHNPAIFDKSIKEIGGLNYPKFVISRLWRDGNVSIPTSEKIIREGDRLLVVTSEKYAPALTVLFGEQEHTDWNKEDIDWNAIDSQLISQRIVVTRPELNGKKLGSLHLRNHYGINISRVYRSGVQLLATAELTLQLGDRLTVVGEAAGARHREAWGSKREVEHDGRGPLGPLRRRVLQHAHPVRAAQEEAACVRRRGCRGGAGGERDPPAAGRGSGAGVGRVPSRV
jgi:uncharacterized transporter YbjL